MYSVGTLKTGGRRFKSFLRNCFCIWPKRIHPVSFPFWFIAWLKKCFQRDNTHDCQIMINHWTSIARTSQKTCANFCNCFVFLYQANDRKNKLTDSYDLQRYLSDYRDLMSWISSMKTLVCSDELAKDVTSAEALLERHQVK